MMYKSIIHSLAEPELPAGGQIVSIRNISGERPSFRTLCVKGASRHLNFTIPINRCRETRLHRENRKKKS